MSNQTGFFRVTIAKRNENIYFKYQIRNQLIKKELIRKDILELKESVEKCGFLWGIIDIKKAYQYQGKYNMKTLQGRYGEKVI